DDSGQGRICDVTLLLQPANYIVRAIDLLTRGKSWYGVAGHGVSLSGLSFLNSEPFDSSDSDSDSGFAPPPNFALSAENASPTALIGLASVGAGASPWSCCRKQRVNCSNMMLETSLIMRPPICARIPTTFSSEMLVTSVPFSTARSLPVIFMEALPLPR